MITAHSDRVTTRVPGSTSNLGSGFDTMGIALNLYNDVTVAWNDSVDVSLRSPIDASVRAGAESMLREMARHLSEATGQPIAGFDAWIQGDLPIARGLGSSVTVRIGALAGLNTLIGSPLEREDIAALAADLEGHPDNAIPSALGGFVAAGSVDNAWRWRRAELSADMAFVAVSPDLEIRTDEARRILPNEYSRADATHILNRSTLVAAGFLSGDVAFLEGLFDDRIHQPYRGRLIPGFERMVRAGVAAGAIGGWLSGSGSTVICLTLEDPEGVAQAMRAVVPDAASYVLRADNQGMRRVVEDS